MRLAIAAFLTLFSLSVFPQQPNQAGDESLDEQNQQDSGQSETDSHNEPADPLEPLTVNINPPVGQIEPIDGNTEGENNGKDQDRLQRIVAKWTIQIAMATWAQVAVGLFGMFFLAWTLNETRKANKIGLRSAKAAEDVVMHNRAWVTMSGRVALPDAELGSGNAAEFITTWKNSGGSPAIEVEIEHMVYPVSVAAYGQTIPTFTPTGKWDTIGVLGPGCTHQGHCQITEQTALELQGRQRVFIYTFIRYKNIYGKRCITESVEEVSLARKIFDNGIGIDGDFTVFESYQDGFAINNAGNQQRAT